MGFTSEQFYQLTPSKLRVFLKQDRTLRQQGQFMLSQLTAAVVNFSMSRPKKPFKAHDFMIDPFETEAKVTPTKKKKHSRKQVADQLRCFFAAGLFGEVKSDG